jgi:hypothetical protein
MLCFLSLTGFCFDWNDGDTYASRGLIYLCAVWFFFGIDMFKNQLQELAQRSCFNLPSYACIREGPDHAPRFKASVNFNGEIFESPSYCTTLRQAEHAAAEVALNVLSLRGPARSLTARVLVSFFCQNPSSWFVLDSFLDCLRVFKRWIPILSSIWLL